MRRCGEQGWLFRNVRSPGDFRLINQFFRSLNFDKMYVSKPEKLHDMYVVVVMPDD